MQVSFCKIPQAGKQINKQLVGAEYTFPKEVLRQILRHFSFLSVFKVDWRMRRAKIQRSSMGRKNLMPWPFLFDEKIVLPWSESLSPNSLSAQEVLNTPSSINSPSDVLGIPGRTPL